MKKYDLLVPGELNPDLILTDPNLQAQFGQAETLVQHAALTPGSSSVIFACGAARLGLKVAFIGVVGNDLFGRFMIEALVNRGVDTSHIIIDPRQQTGLTVILNRVSDRAMLTHLGAINALRAEQIPDDLLAQARHLHLASYFLQTHLRPDVSDLFRRARSLGLSTSLDTNWDPDEKWIGVRALLPLVDVFLPNENEARALTGIDSLEEAARGLATNSKVVAVKLGASGGLAFQGDAIPDGAGDAIQRAPAIPVEVVDTVGAGDTFDAGFVYGFLQGWPMGKALRLGIACGSLSTQKSGGLEGQPTLNEALKYC
ncbi:MAG TPA: carbohydrate kinase [Chloroflexi bacterium]|nr:carbohydrate kinase [Chloroflexota bacterium]